MKILRLIIFLLSSTLFLWLLCPLLGGVLHIGMIYPLPILAAFIFFSARPDVLKMLFEKQKVLMSVISCLVAVGVVIVATLVGVMIRYSCLAPPQNATVVILGCQVRGERPSLMLYDRMNTALEYINQNEDCNVVATGGKGTGEKISEAEAIKRYLVKKGVDESRIFVEDKSVNTDENIKFTSKIIKDNNLNINIAVATDGFHQFRASCFSNKYGLKSSAISCNTRWYFSASYYSREILAIGKMYATNFFEKNWIFLKKTLAFFQTLC